MWLQTCLFKGTILSAMLNYIVRAARDTDVPFIYSAWLRSFYVSGTLTKHISKEVYFNYHKAITDRILLNPHTEVQVACEGDKEGPILGFSVYTDRILHYVYVKKAFRGLGLAHVLIPDT